MLKATFLLLTINKTVANVARVKTYIGHKGPEAEENHRKIVRPGPKLIVCFSFAFIIKTNKFPSINFLLFTFNKNTESRPGRLEKGKLCETHKSRIKQQAILRKH